MEGQEMPTPAETRKAEEMMTPLQAAMTKARYEVMSHEQDLTAAGVSKQQVEDASSKAGERAKLEFEQKEKEDPLRQIERALEMAAETPEEKLLAQAGVKRLEEFRSGWGEMLKREELRAKNAGTSIRIEEVVGKARWNNTTPTFVDARTYGPGHGIDDFPSVRVLDRLVTGEGKGERIDPSPAFRERVLKGMGVLEPDQTLDALKLLPAGEKGYRGPAYRNSYGTEYAERVPTNMKGVDVRADFNWPSINASMDLPTLQKVVNFPKA